MFVDNLIGNNQT